LTEKVKHTAKNLGKVRLGFGGTVCKVPMAIDYNEKGLTNARGGVKRKTVRC
jgi:hypothetical protein